MASVAKQVDFLLAGYRDPATDTPLNAGRIYTYDDETSALVNLWTDSGKVAQATNPIVLDADGKTEVYGDGTYRFDIYRNDGSAPPDIPMESLAGLEYLSAEIFTDEWNLRFDDIVYEDTNKIKILNDNVTEDYTIGRKTLIEREGLDTFLCVILDSQFDGTSTTVTLGMPTDTSVLNPSDDMAVYLAIIDIDSDPLLIPVFVLTSSTPVENNLENEDYGKTYLLDYSVGNFDVTLPVGYDGLTYKFLVIDDSNTGSINDHSGSPLINFKVLGEAALFYYNDGGWHIIDLTNSPEVVTVDTSEVIPYEYSGRTIFLNSNSGDVTITLPTGRDGLKYRFVVIDDTNVSTIQDDTFTTLVELQTRNDSVELINDGTSWAVSPVKDFKSSITLTNADTPYTLSKYEGSRTILLDSSGGVINVKLPEHISGLKFNFIILNNDNPGSITDYDDNLIVNVEGCPNTFTLESDGTNWYLENSNDTQTVLTRSILEWQNETHIKLNAGKYYHQGTNKRIVKWYSQITLEKADVASALNIFYYIYIDDTSVVSANSDILTADEFVINSTEPVWDNTKQGFYNGNDLCIGAVFASSSSGGFDSFQHENGKIFYPFDDLSAVHTFNPGDDDWILFTILAPSFCRHVMIGVETIGGAAQVPYTLYSKPMLVDGKYSILKGVGDVTEFLLYDCFTNNAQEVEFKVSLVTIGTSLAMVVYSRGWVYPIGM